jgi:opacity protein-like surface antigen
MKSSLVSLISLIIIILAVSSIALAQGDDFDNNKSQTKNGTVIYLNSGLALPSAPNEFSSYWKTGFNIGGGVGFPITNNVKFVGSILYGRFGFDGEKLMTDNGFGGYGLQINGGEASILMLSAGYKIKLTNTPNRVVPFICADAGLFRISTSNATMSYQGQTETVTADGGETKLGFDAGAGLNINLTPRTDLVLGAKIVIGLTKGQSTSYFPILIGLEFR